MRKSLLFTLLALILCLSMMLVACGDEPVETEPAETQPTINANPESDKQVIAGALPGFTLEGIFDIENMIPEEGVSVDLDLDAMLDSILEAYRGTALEGTVTINQDGTSFDAYMGIKDGIINLGAMGNNSFINIDKLGSTTITSIGNGSLIEFEKLDMPEIPEMTVEDIKAMIEQYVPAEAQAIIEGFKFPALTPDQLTLEGDYYVVSNDYYKSISKDVLTLVKDLFTVYAPDDVPTQEEFDETVADMDQLIEALGIKLGFAVAGQNIVAVKLEMNIDIEALQDAFGGSVEEDMGNEVIPYSAEEYTDKLYVAMEIKLSADATKLESASFDIEAVVEGQSINVGYDYVITYNGVLPASIAYNVEASIPSQSVEMKYSTLASFTYEGELVKKIDCTLDVDMDVPGTVVDLGVKMSATPIYAEGVIVGADIDTTIEVDGIEQYVDYCYYKGEEEYRGESIYAMGKMVVEIEAKLDGSAIGTANATIMSLDVSGEFKPEYLFYSEYDYESDTVTENKDLSAFEEAPTLADAAMSIGFNAKIAAAGENKCTLTVLATENGETALDLTGSLTVGVADNIAEVPAIIDMVKAEDFADNYAMLETIGEMMLKAESYYSYCQDNVTGLYVYVTYDEIMIGDVEPTDEVLVRRYGEFQAFGING